MHQVSPHLTWEELRCGDGTAYPEAFKNRAVILAAEFEAIREIYGKPITINSGFRTPKYNKAVGGAPQSQHLQGRALDLAPLWRDRSPNTIRQLWAACSAQASKPTSKLRGLGFYDWGCHIDIRPTKDLVSWDFRSLRSSPPS